VLLAALELEDFAVLLLAACEELADFAELDADEVALELELELEELDALASLSLVALAALAAAALKRLLIKPPVSFTSVSEGITAGGRYQINTTS